MAFISLAQSSLLCFSGLFLPLRGLWLSELGGRGATDTYWVEARDANKSVTRHGMPFLTWPQMSIFPGPSMALSSGESLDEYLGQGWAAHMKLA